MSSTSTPVIGQRATFHEGAGEQRVEHQATVKHVWSDTCVNLQLDDGRERTSVLVWPASRLAEAPGGGYFCLLEPMTQRQPAITGYRQLSAAEVELINEGKALAEKCGAYVEKLRRHAPAQQTPGVVGKGEQPALDQRWVSLGATDLQRGFMALIRGIAQPTTF